MFAKLPPYPVYLILSAANAFFFAVWATLSNVYRVEVGLTPMQLVLTGTMLELAVFIFEIPTGIVADVVSRRLSVITGYFIIGLAFVLEGSFPYVGTIWLAQAIWGMGYTFTSGAQDAWLADEIGPEKLTNAYLRAAQLGHILGLAGIGVATWLATYALNIPLVVGGLGLLGLALFLLLFMPETGFAPTPRPERNTWGKMVDTLNEGAAVVRGRHILVVIFAISLFYGLSSEGLDRLWEAHFLENLIFPSLGDLEPVVWFGLIEMGLALLSLAATEIVRRRVNANEDSAAVRWLLIFNTVMIGSVTALALAGRFSVALAAYWSTFIFRSISQPIFSAWVNRQIEPQVRATVLSMFGQTDASGQIAGGPLMGIVATVFSLRAALLGVGVLLSPVLLLFRRAGRYARRHPAGADSTVKVT